MAEGNEFSAARKRLWNEIVAIHDVWEQYVYLFNESPERIRLLNACASWFFGTTQRVMMRETILGISRLTDAPATGPFKNLVLATLITDPEVDVHEGLADEMRAAMNVLDSLVNRFESIETSISLISITKPLFARLRN